uniref:Alternative protein n=1 Tax=Elaeophora elaphi TaxID=1147741 RepID=A0A0R3RP14_9BILA
MTAMMHVMMEMSLMPREVSMMIVMMMMMPRVIPVIVPPARSCHRYRQHS